MDLTTGEPVQGERARPIQAIVWYPALRGGKPITYRDYLDSIATEADFTRGAPSYLKEHAAAVSVP